MVKGKRAKRGKFRMLQIKTKNKNTHTHRGNTIQPIKGHQLKKFHFATLKEENLNYETSKSTQDANLSMKFIDIYTL